MSDKLQGSNSHLYANGFDMGKFVRSGSIDHERDVFDCTTLTNDGWKEYVSGLRGMSFTFEGLYYMPGAESEDDTESQLDEFRTGEQVDILYIASKNPQIGDRATVLRVVQTGEGLQIPVDDLITVNLSGTQSKKPYRAKVLAAKHTDIADTANASLNNGESTNTGLYLLVQVFNTSGDTPLTDLTLEHSANNSTWAPLEAVEGIDARGSFVVEIESGTTINQYLRIVSDLGTDTDDIQYAAAVIRL